MFFSEIVSLCGQDSLKKKMMERLEREKATEKAAVQEADQNQAALNTLAKNVTQATW